ncbi:MAG: hypothetical protein MJ133_01890 [Lachnospiraceae bacterium]|nr:hypothetical protein [Lachnospiraceae bacterium]
MKHFRLAGAGYRNQIDLSIYGTDIAKAVKQVKPAATVDVHKSYFTTSPELTKRESIAVSAILRQGPMAELTTYRPCLFNSTQSKTKAEMEEENVSTSSRRKKMGGRHRNSGKISTNQ